MTTVIKDFRHDINALRAIAVLGVVLFHFKVPYADGGFAGVDVFFVISGYLMSRIILKGIDRGNFSVLDFYGKRVKRIIPALLVMILVVLGICFFIYLPFEYKVNQKNGLASILFLSNIFYWFNSGYFDPSSDTNLFLHTWSLSVEWQFYLIYPLILIGLNKLIKKRSALLTVFIISTLAIYLFGAWYTKVDANATFYWLPTRSWEMMFGGIAFLSEDFFNKLKYKNLLAIAGYLTIFVCFVLFKSSLPWPGTLSIVPVVATFFIIAVSCNSFALLKSGPVQFIGRTSYSIYLWHWPVYVISQYFGIELTLVNTVILIALSVGLGYLSYRLVESADFKTNRPILVAGAGLAALILAIGYLDLNKHMFKKKTLTIANYAINNRTEKKSKKEKAKESGKGGGCFISGDNVIYNKESCLYIDSTKSNILLIGDSHSSHFATAFKEVLGNQNVNLMQASAIGCLPIMDPSGNRKCQDLINYVYKDLVVKHAGKIKGVIISANWMLPTYNITHKDLLQQLNSTITYLQQHKLKVVVLGQSEAYIIPYPTIAAKEFQYNMKMSERYIDKAAYETNDYLIAGLKPYYINIINQGNFPGLGPKDIPYMTDKNHYSSYGSRLTVNRIVNDPLFKEFLK